MLMIFHKKRNGSYKLRQKKVLCNNYLCIYDAEPIEEYARQHIRIH